jgi:hypothetical protein
MSFIKWAAVLVTALMGLMNAGLAFDSSHGIDLRLAGATLAALAVAAIVGLVAQRSWGTPAAIAVGLLNALIAVVGAFAGVQGWPIGLIVGGLGALLATVTKAHARGEGAVA